VRAHAEQRHTTASEPVQGRARVPQYDDVVDAYLAPEVHTGSAVNKRLHNLDLASQCGHHQRSLVTLDEWIRLCAELKQQSHHLHIT
jgi:hypothetical protein